MTDIVKRLREPDWLTDFEAKLVHDAADEIERLRGLLREGLKHSQNGDWRDAVREALGDE